MLGSRQDVRDALNAIVRGCPTDEAYEVAEQAGYRELFRGVIYKFKESQMEVSIARAIIKQAQKDETYGGPMPEDDGTAVKEAENLVDMAKQAWDQYIRGPEVEIIIKLAENGEQHQNGNAPEVEGEQQEEPKAEKKSDDDEDEIAPPQDLEGVDEQLMKIEPWEGYSEDRVKEITEGINIALESDDDPQSLIAHIWAYESSHKRRVRILKHVKEAWERVNGSDENQKAEAGSSEVEAGSVDPENDAGDEPKVSQEAEVAPDSGDAGSDSEPEAREQASESRKPASEAPSQDKAYRTIIEAVDKQLKNERIDIPKPPTDDIPELPWRWSEIKDSELHDWHMQYGAMAYYKSYVFSREERLALHCREAADELSRKLMLASNKYDEKGKQKTVTLLEAEIESDDNVKKWRRLQRKHEAFAQAAKREMESYHKLVETLSRLETMRHNAFERGRR